MNKLLVTTAVGFALLAISSVSIAAESTTTTTSSTTTNTVAPMAVSFEASNILKADVKTKTGETIGAVQDLIVGRDGIVVGVVAEVGNYLGVTGERDVMLDWKSLSIQQVGNKVSVTSDLDKNAISQKQPYKVVSR